MDTELTLERAKTLISKDEASPWSDCVRAPPLWWWIYPRFEPATEAVFRRTLTTRDSDIIPLIAILLGGAWAAGITLTGVVESGNPAGLIVLVVAYPAVLLLALFFVCRSQSLARRRLPRLPSQLRSMQAQ